MTEEQKRIYKQKNEEYRLGKISKTEWCHFCGEFLTILMKENKKVLDNLKKA